MTLREIFTDFSVARLLDVPVLDLLALVVLGYFAWVVVSRAVTAILRRF